jgi:hypothetical protein
MHSHVNILQQRLDDFLKELEAVTGQINNLQMFHHNEEIIVLVIYSCWKKI